MSNKGSHSGYDEIVKQKASDQSCDCRAHKQPEDQLRESEQRYRSLANSGQALVWTSGLDMACDYFNDVWLTFTGRTMEFDGYVSKPIDAAVLYQTIREKLHGQ